MTFSEARLTFADFTPSVADNDDIMLAAQEAHDIPSTGNISLIVGMGFFYKFKPILNNKNNNINRNRHNSSY